MEQGPLQALHSSKWESGRMFSDFYWNIPVRSPGAGRQCHQALLPSRSIPVRNGAWFLWSFSMVSAIQVHLPPSSVLELRRHMVNHPGDPQRCDRDKGTQARTSQTSSHSHLASNCGRHGLFSICQLFHLCANRKWTVDQKKIFEAHCSQKRWTKCHGKAPWCHGTLWQVKHPTKLSVPVSNFDEKHAPTYPHAFMHESMNAWERAEAAQNIQRWSILICLALVQILHQLWNFSHLNQQGTRNGANSRSNSQKDQQITLLRVIPTMTCWVEVVRWGLSLRIWWEEWRIWEHWFQVSLA